MYPSSHSWVNGRWFPQSYGNINYGNDLGFVPSPYHGNHHGIINKGDVIGYTNNKLTWMCLKMGYNRQFMATWMGKMNDNYDNLLESGNYPIFSDKSTSSKVLIMVDVTGWCSDRACSLLLDQPSSVWVSVHVIHLPTMAVYPPANHRLISAINFWSPCRIIEVSAGEISHCWFYPSTSPMIIIP